MIYPASIQSLRKARRLRDPGRWYHRDKQLANRVYRRQATAITRLLAVDVEAFDSETYQTKCYTSWDYV